MIFVYLALALLAVVAAANLVFGRLPAAPVDSGGVIETAAGPIHYVETVGEGPPVVFFHGMPSTSREFDRIRAELPGRHTIAFDRPGYAWSTGAPQDFAEQIDALTEAAGSLGIERAILVGHSFGGLLALGTAIRRPQFVEALVLIAPAAGGSRVTEKMLGQARWIERVERPVVRGVCDLFFLRLLRRHAARLGASSVYGDAPEFAAERHVAESMLARHNSVAALAHDRLLFNDAERLVTRGLARIGVPTVIIQGESDRTVTMRHAHRLADALNESRMVVLTGGHQITSTHPAEIAAEIRSF